MVRDAFVCSIDKQKEKNLDIKPDRIRNDMNNRISMMDNQPPKKRDAHRLGE